MSEAVRECVGCGCTDSTPCIDDYGQACAWASLDPPMCTACADEKDEPLVQLYGEHEAQRLIDALRSRGDV